MDLARGRAPDKREKRGKKTTTHENSRRCVGVTQSKKDLFFRGKEENKLEKMGGGGGYKEILSHTMYIFYETT